MVADPRHTAAAAAGLRFPGGPTDPSRTEMVRLADPRSLRAHQARFDVASLPRTGLDALEVRSLDALLERPYQDLDARDVAHALHLIDRAGLHAQLFAYFLPAALRRPPYKDLLASERLLTGLLAAATDDAVHDWDPEIEETLVTWLSTRPLRGGDDPVDLWLAETSLRRRELEAARRLPSIVRIRSGLSHGWREATEGPIYVRLALLLLSRWPAAAERRLRAWEVSAEPNHSRAWIELMFHAHGEGWRAEQTALESWLASPDRLEAAESLLSHSELDVAIGASAVALLLAPRRARELRGRIAGRLAALDVGEPGRFVLTPTVRKLLVGER